MLRAFRVAIIVAVTGTTLLSMQPLSARAGKAELVAAQAGSVPTLDVKLGLWEVTSASTRSGMPTIDTSKMTPEQRARVEAALQGSAALGSAPQVRKECMTKEKLEQESFQVADANAGACKRSILSSTRSLQAVHIECAGQRKSTTDLRIEVLSPENVKISGKIVVGEGANPMTINVNADAKWLSAACGDAK